MNTILFGLRRTALVLGLAALWSQAAAAGFYLGNDIGSKGTGEATIESLLGCDVLQLCVLEDGNRSAGGFSISGYGKSGGWNYAGTEFEVCAVSIKAGNGYVVYEVDGDSGYWNTRLLGDKNLSHATFWGKCRNPNVPEPVSVIPALAVIGFGWLLRRRLDR